MRRLLRTDDWAPLVVVHSLIGIVLGAGLLGRAFAGADATVHTPAVIGA